ncbi:hypothetical protein [Leifsonia sp. TF02-11]|uniref:hypothetical protein n=1 Tax=Leifsonia sp. TF02-11 TaxID=2815212 RepID=UPI001AA0E704|nr:hypothetical protein [Leifsonia sp. TF02-11]MBO1740397.1 hypothetical protein [Leifsonia sp. TF02-11]
MPTTTLIIGSYRRHFAQILSVKSALEDRGVQVLAPESDQIVNPGESFALLESDEDRTPRQVQDRIFSLVRRADFLVLANIDGYLGAAATMELGYAIAVGTDVLTIEPVVDPNIGAYTRLFDLEALPGLPDRHAQEHAQETADDPAG